MPRVSETTRAVECMIEDGYTLTKIKQVLKDKNPHTVETAYYRTLRRMGVVNPQRKARTA